MDLLKFLTDSIYGTSFFKKNYTKANPAETILAADAAKGMITKDDDDLKYGTHWITSQRGILILTDNKVVFGKWTIDLHDIQSAQLVKIKTVLGGGQVLKLRMKDGKNYQFGMQSNPEWINQQVLPLDVQEGELKYSTFSVIIRIVAFAVLIHWIYKRFLS